MFLTFRLSTRLKITWIFEMSNGTAYFEFDMGGYGSDEDRFVIELVQPEKISHARRILAGEETQKAHVMGKITELTHCDA